MYQKQDYTGSLMNSEEEEWMKNYEKERFGRPLDRDINGNPIEEGKEGDK